MEEPVNPMHPTSLGALLAEEWTINPLSTLPSFLEMVMMEEASRSTEQAIGGGIATVERRLERLHRNSEDRLNSFVEEEESSSVASEKSLVRRRLELYWIDVLRWRSLVAERLSFFLKRYKAEVQYLAIYVLERQCLKSDSCGRLMETLYGGRRVKLASDSSPSGVEQRRIRLLPMSEADKTRAALFAALIPYLRVKLDDHRDRWEKGELEASNDSIRSFMGSYPYLKLLLQLSNVLNRWGFLLGRTFCYDLSMLFLRQSVRRVARADSTEAWPREKTSTVDQVANAEFDYSDTAGPAKRSIAYLAAASVAFSWLTQIRARWLDRRRRTASQLPPPPLPAAELPRLQRRGCCPICQRAWVNPAACTSGYVYCYACILPFLRQYKRCPITGQACDESSLVRLFEPNQQEDSQPGAEDTPEGTPTKPTATST